MLKTLRARLYIFTVAAVLFLSPFMAGCAGADKVFVNGGCEIPAQYDVVKAGPVDLTRVDPKGHAEEVALERADHKTDADDFNGFHDYVRDKCK